MGHQTNLVYKLLPLEDCRWDSFLQEHRHSSVFHSKAWLQALRNTYNYEPIAYTSSPSDSPLRNAIIACRVESWFTGRRLVSLPFSDHSEALVEDSDDLRDLFAELETTLLREKLRYVEMRPLFGAGFASSLSKSVRSYCFHQLDLTPTLDSIFKGFHKDSIQRKIRRSEREKLVYVEGNTEHFLNQFYRLFVTTRKRHGLPPQPLKWFSNLIESFGSALKIRIALKGERPVASILTLQFKDTLVYKYGCSNAEYNNLGGMSFLFWMAIQEAHGAGLKVFDLGRSDLDNLGLITFKERWGATRSTLTYTRYHARGDSGLTLIAKPSDWMSIAKQVISHTPSQVLTAAGKILYKHIG